MHRLYRVNGVYTGEKEEEEGENEGGGEEEGKKGRRRGKNQLNLGE